MSQIDHFLNAVKAGDQAQVHALLDAEPGLAAARSEAGVSAVLLAIYHRQPAIAEALIERGLALDIFEAAATGRAERVAELLEADASLVNAYGADGFTPLGLAAFFGQKAAFDSLLARGADVNQPTANVMKVRPLHAALAQGNPEAAYPMADALLAAGADANAAQEGGWTPLHEAAHHGYQALVDLLLEHGADPNQASNDGSSALALAMKAGHQSVAERLRQAAFRA